MNKPKNIAQTIRLDILPRFDDMGSGVAGDGRAAGMRRDLLRPDDYQFLFQNSYDATLLTRVDGRIMAANARAEDLLCCAEAELCEMSVLQIISGMDEALLESIVAQLDRARFMRISAWCARREGDPFPSEIAVSRLKRREETWLAFYIRDESVRRRAEDELRTVHNAIQNAGTGIAIADTEGRLVHLNPALRRMWRIADDTPAGSITLAGLLGEVTAAAVLQIVAPGAHPVWTNELPVHFNGEETLWVQVSAAANVDPDNLVTGVVLSFVDVSDRCRAEAVERLRDRDRIMAQSLGAVCHHLGQPTTVLLSSIEMMRAARENDPGMVETLLNLGMEAAEELRQVLRKLNDLEIYKTVPYVGAGGDDAPTAIISLDRGDAPAGRSGTPETGARDSG